MDTSSKIRVRNESKATDKHVGDRVVVFAGQRGAAHKNIRNSLATSANDNKQLKQ